MFRKSLSLSLYSLATLVAVGIPAAHAAPAVVIRLEGPFCSLFDGNGNLVSGNAFKVTLTQSANGNATAQCKGDVTPKSSGGAAHFDFASTGGVLCLIGSQTTQHWEETVSANGNATITCRLP